MADSTLTVIREGGQIRYSKFSLVFFRVYFRETAPKEL